VQGGWDGPIHNVNGQGLIAIKGGNGYRSFCQCHASLCIKENQTRSAIADTTKKNRPLL
jgi:hypothetical protein